MELLVAKNLDEYSTIINNLKSTEQSLWYRGMSSASYLLEPSLFREKSVIGLEYSGREINGRYYRKSEAIMKSDLAAIDSFIEQYSQFYPEKTKNYNLVDYLYIMQHYDIPTRLLDFSKDELIALYFAVANLKKDKVLDCDEEIEDYFEKDGDSDLGASVHIIDPIYTNENTNIFVNLKDQILNIDNIDIDVLSNIDLPLCIETDNQDSRIISQKGVFLLFGRAYKPYEYYDIFNRKTVKIFIPNSCRSLIKQELKETLKISHRSVFPDIKGISMEIIEQIEDKYKKDCFSVFGK